MTFKTMIQTKVMEENYDLEMNTNIDLINRRLLDSFSAKGLRDETEDTIEQRETKWCCV